MSVVVEGKPYCGNVVVVGLVTAKGKQDLIGAPMSEELYKSGMRGGTTARCKAQQRKMVKKTLFLRIYSSRRVI